MLNLLKTLLFLLISLTWVPSLQALSPQELTPVQGNVDIYHLRNQTYFFPANYSSEDSTIFLPLKRWDLIFTGDRINHSADTVEWENTNDLITGFPYQLEIEHSGNLLDRNIYLVDDGFKGGAGCSDYWTALFEEYAGLCIKNVRMTTNELEDYFHNDSQGRQAYVPPEISPFPNRVLVRQLLDLGFRAISVSPHVHACDGSEESGLVLPYLIMESDMLEEIPRLNLPLFPRFWFFR